MLREKREFPRVPVDVDVDYKIIDFLDPDELAGQSKNISVGGICIIMLEKASPGTNLELNFLIPELNKKIKAKGTIAWTKEFSLGKTQDHKAYDAGIEFTDISKEDKQQIDLYVQRRLMI